MTAKMYGYYEKFDAEGIILYFNGPVSQSAVEGIANLMRAKMRSEATGGRLSMKVFAILVEQMQNIVRYSVDRHKTSSDDIEEIANGQIIVGRESDGRFYIACGNRIEIEQEAEIARRIETIRSMSKKELKAYYKEQRRGVSDTRGAGLGFIEMARHAVEPLDYSIVPVDCNTSFFSMKVVA